MGVDAWAPRLAAVVIAIDIQFPAPFFFPVIESAVPGESGFTAAE